MLPNKLLYLKNRIKSKSSKNYKRVNKNVKVNSRIHMRVELLWKFTTNMNCIN